MERIKNEFIESLKRSNDIEEIIQLRTRTIKNN